MTYTNTSDAVVAYHGGRIEPSDTAEVTDEQIEKSPSLRAALASGRLVPATES